jgi:GNAT superfamily N-acetyltransferase
MSIRIGTRADIPELQIIRSSVTENILTSIITEEMIIDVMEKYGRIWIYDLQGQAVGFSASDKRTSNIWALFVLPAWEKRGNGKRLLHEAVQ